MANYKKQELFSFVYEIEDLVGEAICYISDNGYGLKLYKYIDEEHGVSGQGYFDIKEARKSFRNKIKELVA